MHKRDLVFDTTAKEFQIKLRIVQEGAALSTGDASSEASTTKKNSVDSFDDEVHVGMAPSRVFASLKSNSSAAHLHVLVMASGRETDEVTSAYMRSGAALYSVINMVKFDRIPKHYSHRYLLSDLGLNILPVMPYEVQRAKLPTDTIIAYWKPEVAVRLVTDFSQYPLDYVPPSLDKHLVYSRQGAGRGRGQDIPKYSPPLHADEIGLTSDKYIPLNESIQSLPLQLSYGPMSLQRWLLMEHMEQSLSSQSGMGFADKDIDDVRRLISDTSIYLLGITFLASLLHLLFEALAFQSDIVFWQNNKSLAGLSARTVITDLISQTVVFLFLLESDTSVLVTIPAFIGLFIQAWKVRRATGICLRWTPPPPSASLITNISSLVPSLHFARWEAELAIQDQPEDSKAPPATPTEATTDAGSVPSEVQAGSPQHDPQEVARLTLQADRYATVLLTLILVPLVLGLAARSLIMDRHASWYSWGIGALTGCVYTLGFIMMCPQLFINHKLKSVAYLPWNFLIYKFINTFIDDLFAFIIKMPTMHRISCFRDDIVFLVYLYQRWIYRVDESRPAEK